MKSSKDELSYYPESFFRNHAFLRDILLHGLMFIISLIMAYLIAYDVSVKQAGTLPPLKWFTTSFPIYMPFFVLTKLLIYWRMELLRGGWRYAGIKTVSQILIAGWWFVAISVVLYMVFSLEYLQTVPVLSDVAEYFHSIPKRLLVLDFLSSVFLVSSARLGYRIYRQELRPVSEEGFKRVLIIGAGDAGESIIREINRMKVDRYYVVGLIDDDPTKRKMVIHQVPVLGTTEDIPELCTEHKIEEIILAIPSATRKQLNHVVDICSGTQAKIKTLPSVADLIDGRVAVSQIKAVDINDLLGRDAIKLDTTAISQFITGRVVLVTGAGGSIGSEMCRQMSQYKPSHLILLEQAETPLFDIENELRKDFPNAKITPVICDIFDRDRVMKVWETLKPEVVIHAAAHKHVPLMELNPCEAIKNNILGSKNVADASSKFGSAEFVTISTDKAVNPSSVMGCSKRVGEIYTQSLNDRPECNTNFKAVRFGNVLGSNGSVIPTFRRQIAAGGPVTVTHPDMTRYFMTIPEAAQLVLQAAATGQGGQIFLLDMGDPVKIDHLARQMITLSGLRPDEDIEVAYTGVRPGEKLFEELKNRDENIEPTVHSKVMVWKHNHTPWSEITSAMERFTSLENSPNRDAIVTALKDFVPEYTPLNPPKETSLEPGTSKNKG